MILIKCLILIESCIEEDTDEAYKANEKQVGEVDKAEADKEERTRRYRRCGRAADAAVVPAAGTGAATAADEGG